MAGRMREGERESGGEIPRWQRGVIAAFWTYFAGSALLFAASFTCFFWIWKRAVPAPDAAHPAALTSHGQTLYVTAGQSQLYHFLLAAGITAVLSVFVLGFLLQYVFRIPVFDNDRTAL